MMKEIEKRFLEDIITNKSSDIPRLIYSDWLEDERQKFRAEFIRYQIKLAKLKRCPHWRVGDTILRIANHRCEWCDLSHLTRTIARSLDPETLQSYGHLWANITVGSVLYSYSRGFVTNIQIYADAWLACADELVTSYPLEQVSLVLWFQRHNEVLEALVESRIPTQTVAGRFNWLWPGIVFTVSQKDHDPGFEVWGDYSGYVEGDEYRIPEDLVPPNWFGEAPNPI